MDRLEDRNTADVPLSEIEKRRRVIQGLADGKQGIEAQLDDLLFRFFIEDFNPMEIAIRDP